MLTNLNYHLINNFWNQWKQWLIFQIKIYKVIMRIINFTIIWISTIIKVLTLSFLIVIILTMKIRNHNKIEQNHLLVWMLHHQLWINIQNVLIDLNMILNHFMILIFKIIIINHNLIHQSTGKYKSPGWTPVKVIYQIYHKTGLKNKMLIMLFTKLFHKEIPTKTMKKICHNLEVPIH